VARERAKLSAAEGLADLLRRRQEALDSAAAIERTQREATTTVARCSRELEELERRAIAAGEQVSQAARQRAEKALADAKREAAKPWSEHAKAAKFGADDLRGEAGRFAVQHLDELLEGLHERGEAAARMVDAGARMVLDGFAERGQVEQETFALITLIRPARPGDVQRTRGEQLAAEATKLLAGGGEAPPDVLVRPDESRHVPAIGARLSA
jgi:hypothetical protein